MKPLDLVKILCQATGFGGTFEYSRAFDGESAFLRNLFGAQSHHPQGVLKGGTYFYVYAEDYTDILPIDMPPADMCIQTEEAGNVWVWKIED